MTASRRRRCHLDGAASSRSLRRRLLALLRVLLRLNDDLWARNDSFLNGLRLHDLSGLNELRLLAGPLNEMQLPALRNGRQNRSNLYVIGAGLLRLDRGDVRDQSRHRLLGLRVRSVGDDQAVRDILRQIAGRHERRQLVRRLLLVLIGDRPKNAGSDRNLLVDRISARAHALQNHIPLAQVQVLILIRHDDRLALHLHAARHENLVDLLLLRLTLRLLALRRLLSGERDGLPALVLEVLDVQQRRLLRRNQWRNVLHGTLLQNRRRSLNLHDFRWRSLLHRLNYRRLRRPRGQRWKIHVLTRRNDDSLNDFVVGRADDVRSGAGACCGRARAHVRRQNDIRQYCRLSSRVFGDQSWFLQNSSRRLCRHVHARVLLSLSRYVLNRPHDRVAGNIEMRKRRLQKFIEKYR